MYWLRRRCPSTSLVHARCTRRAATRLHLKTLLSSMGRVSRGDALMRKLISEGFVGQVRQVMDYRMDGRYADAGAPLHWRESRRFSGVNFQFLGERANIIRRWLGEHCRVFAQSRTYYPDRTGASEEGQLPDAMNVLAELEDGTPVSYIHSGIARFAGPPRVEIYGSEGTLVYYLDAMPGARPEEILGARVDEDQLRPILIPDDLVSRFAIDEEFIAMIRDGKDPAPDLRRVRRVSLFRARPYMSSHGLERRAPGSARLRRHVEQRIVVTLSPLLRQSG